MLAKKNKRTGELGEKLASDYLLSKGYTIFKENINFSNQEIDLIAIKNKKYYIVEVKTSSYLSLSQPEDYCNQRKLINLKKAANQFSRAYKIKPEIIFFDLLALRIDREGNIVTLKHYKNII